MGLEIALEVSEVEAGGTVRGRVQGLAEWSEARGARVALRHDTRNLKAGSGREAPIVAAGSGGATFTLPVPADAFPTFEGEHYRSRWVVEAVVDRPWKRDVKAEAEVAVRPGRAPEPAVEPVVGAWGGYRRFRRFLALFVVIDLALLAAVWVAVGEVPGFVLFALLAPAALSLAALGILALAGSSVDRLELVLPRRAWRFGETLHVEVALEADAAAVTALSVALKGEEVWVVSTGQTTTTRRETIHEASRLLAGTELSAARARARRWVWPVELALPESGPSSRGKEIRWTVRAWATVPRRPDPAVELEIDVAGRVPDEAR